MDVGAPSLDVMLLVRAHNAGEEYAPLIDRVLASAKKAEIVRERRRLLRLAVAVMGGDIATLAGRVARRMQDLASVARWQVIDVQTAEGVVYALLLLNGGQPWAHSTLHEALSIRPTHRSRMDTPSV